MQTYAASQASTQYLRLFLSVARRIFRGFAVVLLFCLLASIDVPSFYFESCPFMLLKLPL